MDISPELGDDLLKLLAAFFLTSVFGAAVGSYFQNRTWRHQQEVMQRENERKDAIQIFNDITSLLDRRLYRYRQIGYAFRSGDDDWVDRAFAEYREVLYEWNDNLNRNYARIEIYFGIEARQSLETKITKDIIWIGTLLERIKKNSRDAVDIEEVRAKIDHVNALVYDFDRSLLKKIELSDIGQFRTQSCRCN